MVASKKNRWMLAGALGGALGGVAMKAIVCLSGGDAFGLSSQTDAAAARAVFGEGLEQSRAECIGSAMHYGFGVLTGVAYAALTRRLPVLRTGHGTAFGGALWLIGDELAVAAARLESPGAASPVAHISALTAHLLYGVIVDACLPRGG